jgi:hypothetical protein
MVLRNTEGFSEALWPGGPSNEHPVEARWERAVDDASIRAACCGLRHCGNHIFAGDVEDFYVEWMASTA